MKKTLRRVFILKKSLKKRKDFFIYKNPKFPEKKQTPAPLYEIGLMQAN